MLTTLLKKTFTRCQFWDRFQHSNFLKYWLVGCRYSITRYVSTTNIYVAARIYAISEDSEIPRCITYLIFGARSSIFFSIHHQPSATLYDFTFWCWRCWVKCFQSVWCWQFYPHSKFPKNAIKKFIANKYILIQVPR